MGVDRSLIRRRCEARLRGLDLPSPFDAGAFCRSLAARRARPIALHPFHSLAGPCGLWVATPTTDFIFYEQATTPLHQQHIILHEASHLLCGHTATRPREDERLRFLLPDLDEELVRSVLRRATYSAEDEQEAELLASLIVARGGRL